MDGHAVMQNTNITNQAPQNGVPGQQGAPNGNR